MLFLLCHIPILSVKALAKASSTVAKLSSIGSITLERLPHLDIEIEVEWNKAFIQKVRKGKKIVEILFIKSSLLEIVS